MGDRRAENVHPDGGEGLKPCPDIQQASNTALGEVTHVGGSRGRANPTLGDSMPLGDLPNEGAEFIGCSAHRLSREVVPNELRQMRRIAVHLGVPFGPLLQRTRPKCWHACYWFCASASTPSTRTRQALDQVVAEIPDYGWYIYALCR
jgi:hypothetical protein